MKDEALKIVEDAIDENVKAFRLDSYPQPGKPMTAEITRGETRPAN